MHTAQSLFLAAAFAVLGSACGDEPTVATTTAAQAVGETGVTDSPTFAKEVAAHAALTGGKHEEALRLYDELLALDPKNLPARINRAATLSLLGRNEEALVATEECLAADPKDPEIRINRAQILYNLARHQEAQESI
jgi:tetratricopeptide (TPR) repeat protein